jgi:tetratricopeptide (TPR) repeat protein
MLKGKDYQQFIQYKKASVKVKNGIENKITFSQKEIDEFIALNENYYYSWFLVGNYYLMKNNYTLAHSYYSKALSLEIPQKSEFDEIVKLVADCAKKMK